MHDQEINLIKQRFKDKMDQDKKYIELESAQLLEESTDIDSQIAFLKIDLENKLQADQKAANDALRSATLNIEKENERRLQDERERIKADFQARLDRER